MMARITYVMRFPKGQLPPARGFWSLTMYDAEYFFVPNVLNRYSISARQGLKSNPDGSVDLYIQKDSPGAAKESNWLPAPPGKFILMLRMYWPSEKNPSILNGSWTIPAVKKIQLTGGARSRRGSAPAATPLHRRQRRMRDAAPASAWMASSTCSSGGGRTIPRRLA